MTHTLTTVYTHFSLQQPTTAAQPCWCASCSPILRPRCTFCLLRMSPADARSCRPGYQGMATRPAATRGCAELVVQLVVGRRRAGEEWKCAARHGLRAGEKNQDEGRVAWCERRTRSALDARASQQQPAFGPRSTPTTSQPAATEATARREARPGGADEASGQSAGETWRRAPVALPLRRFEGRSELCTDVFGWTVARLLRRAGESFLTVPESYSRLPVPPPDRHDAAVSEDLKLRDPKTRHHPPQTHVIH